MTNLSFDCIEAKIEIDIFPTGTCYHLTALTVIVFRKQKLLKMHLISTPFDWMFKGLALTRYRTLSIKHWSQPKDDTFALYI